MQELMKNIIEIKDEKGIRLDVNAIHLVHSVSKYSSTKDKIWHLMYHGKHITRKDKFVFQYECITCGSIHNVGTIQFLRKLRKNSRHCYICKNLEETTKCTDKTYDPKKKEINFREEREKSIQSFEELDDDVRSRYFSFHLMDDDFHRISKNLIGLHNGHLSDMSSYEYWSIYKTNNQMRFSSVFYDRINDTIFKAHQPLLRCDLCMQIWRAKSLERFKNCIRIMCRDCSCVNKTFKIRKTVNVEGHLIMYQSKLELKFIRWCNNNNILVKNGPKIQYFFGDKERFYRVDFQIKQTLIEIKDNHIWHINDLKWKSKEDAVRKQIDAGLYDGYIFIEPKVWDQSLKLIDKI